MKQHQLAILIKNNTKTTSNTTSYRHKNHQLAPAVAQAIPAVECQPCPPTQPGPSTFAPSAATIRRCWSARTGPGGAGGAGGAGPGDSVGLYVVCKLHKVII